MDVDDLEAPPIKKGKRLFPDLESSPTGHTPAEKRVKDDLVAWLLTKFTAQVGSRVSRDRVHQLMTDDGFIPLPNLTIIGRAMRKAFPDWKRDGHFKIYYGNVGEKVATPEPHGTVVMTVTVEEAVAIQALRDGDWLGVLEKLSGSGDVAAGLMAAQAHLEMVAYARRSSSLLRDTDVDSLLAFNLQALQAEFEEHLPTAWLLVQTMCTRDDNRNVNKTAQSIVPALTLAVAKMAAIYSNQLSAVRYITGISLTSGGAKDTCINRFAAMFDSVKQVTLLHKLNELAGKALEPLHEWRRNDEPFKIIFDNVNKHVKARHQTTEHGHSMHNLTHGISVKDRILSAGLSAIPRIPVNVIEPSDILPGPAHLTDITSKLSLIVRKIWARHIPALEWMACSPEPHRYSDFTSQKTQKVNLGVLKKNEAVKSEMLDVIKTYHDFVPVKDGEISQHVLLVGDYLSFASGKSAQESQADNVTTPERLEGLIMCMADFHAEMNLIDLIYRLLYNVDSTRAPGTIQWAKSLLHTKNISAENASKNYFDSSELFDKLLSSYLVTGALEMLGMSSQADACPIPSEERTEEKAQQLSEQFVTSMVDLDVPDAGHQPTTSKQCGFCPRKFQRVKKLIEHHKSTHPDEESLVSDVADPVFAYTRCLITVGLLRQLLRSSIKHANGEDVMLVYRYMFIMTKANDQKNYGCGLLETLMQTEILPECLAESMVWNRFANNRGRADSNISLDLHLEHENRTLKSELSAYRGTYSQAHLDRISMGMNLRERILEILDDSLRFHKPTGKGTADLDKNDVAIMVERLKGLDLLTEKASRSAHSANLAFVISNPMKAMGGSDLTTWMSERMMLASTKHYYKQFLP